MPPWPRVRVSTTSRAGWSGSWPARPAQAGAGRPLGPGERAADDRRPRPSSGWRRGRRWSSGPGTGRARCSAPGPASCAPWSAGAPRPTCRCPSVDHPALRPPGMVLSRAADGGWLVEGGLSAAGSFLDWLGRLTGHPLRRAGRAGRRRSPPGARGVVGRPLAGRRPGPVVEARCRGRLRRAVLRPRAGRPGPGRVRVGGLGGPAVPRGHGRRRSAWTGAGPGWHWAGPVPRCRCGSTC